MFTFRLLGGASLEGEAGPLSGRSVQPRRLAILALLAIDPRHSLSRDKLIGYLWPERDADQGRHRLSESLYVLRKELGEATLVSEGESVRLDPGQFLCDAITFTESIRGGDLEGAVASYTGPFMDGFFLKNAPEFNRWVESVRAELAEDLSRALESLASDADRAGDHRKAVEWWGRLSGHDPYNSRFVLGRMEALARAGDPGNAISFAREHERFLREELGTEPTPEVLAFAERLKRGEGPIPGAARDTEGSAEEKSAEEGFAEKSSPEKGFAEVQPASGGLEGVSQQESPGGSEGDSGRQAPETPFLGGIGRMGAGAVAIMILLVGAGSAFVALRPEPGLDLLPDLVMVPPFENRTGDPALDEIGDLVQEWIETAIREVQGVQVVPASFARQYTAEAERVGSLNPTRVAAERAKAGWLVDGVLESRGDSLEFRAEILDLSHEKKEQDVFEVGRREPLNDLMDRFSRRVSGALAYEFDPWMGEIETGSNPLPSAPTIDAFREHRLGYEAYNIPDRAASFRHHMAAFALDTTLIRAVVAAAHMATDRELKDSLASFADHRRDRLSRAGQLDLDILLAGLAGDREGALAAIKEMALMEGGGFNSVLLAWFAIQLNRPREALAFTKRYDPTLEWRKDEAHLYWHFRAQALHLLGDFQEELAEARRGRESYPTRPNLLIAEVRALAALGRVEEVSSLLHQARALSSTLYNVALEAGTELREHGFLEESKAAFNRAAEWLVEVQPTDDLETGMVLDSEQTLDLVRALYGAERWAEARESALDLLAESPDDLSTLGMVGLTAARSGDGAMAAEVIEQLSGMSRRDRRGEHLYLMASIQAVLDQPDEAMKLLYRASSEGFPFSIQIHRDMNLESLRVREDFQAFLAPKG